MRPIECPNKHFYDADKYDYCPHCKALGITPELLHAEPLKKKRRHLFEKKKQPASPSQQTGASAKPIIPAPLPSVKRMGLSVADDISKNDGREVSAPGARKQAPSAPVDDFPAGDDRTMALFDGDAYASSAPVDDFPAGDDRTMALFDGDAYAPSAPVDDFPAGDDRTMALFDGDAYAPSAPVDDFPAGDDRTMALFDGDALPYDQQPQITPVAGWLVALNGASRGRDFPLRDGVNTICCSPDDGDLRLNPDDRLRNASATLTFDPHKRQFVLRPDSSGAVLVNHAAVVDAVGLESYDHIHFYNNEYIILALCGNRFTWDEDV